MFIEERFVALLWKEHLLLSTPPLPPPSELLRSFPIAPSFLWLSYEFDVSFEYPGSYFAIFLPTTDASLRRSSPFSPSRFKSWNTHFAENGALCRLLMGSGKKNNKSS